MNFQINRFELYWTGIKKREIFLVVYFILCILQINKSNKRNEVEI